MLNWPVVLNQNVQAGSCSIMEIIEMKRNELEK